MPPMPALRLLQGRQVPYERAVGWASLPAARAPRPASLSAGGTAGRDVELQDRARTPTHRIQFRRAVDLEPPTGVRRCTDASRHGRAYSEHSCGCPLPAVAGPDDLSCRRFSKCVLTQVSEAIQSPQWASFVFRVRVFP